MILSERVRKEIGSFLKNSAQARSGRAAYCIATQWSCFHQCDAVDAIQGNLRDGRDPNVLTFGQTDFRDTA